MTTERSPIEQCEQDALQRLQTRRLVGMDADLILLGSIAAEKFIRDNPVKEYLFDVKMFASVRVKAKSVSEARAMLHAHLDCADCNFGAWPDGTPILAEASVDDGELPCCEVDGEWTDECNA